MEIGLQNGFVAIGEAAAMAAWVGQLGQMSRLNGFQVEGFSEYTIAEERPHFTGAPSPPRNMSRLLADDPLLASSPFELNHLAFFDPSDPFSAGVRSFFGQPLNAIGGHQDLLAALRSVSKQKQDAEYAIEREGAQYAVYKGTEGSVVALGDLFLHTHRDSTALPSEPDLQSFSKSHRLNPHYYSLIYSRPQDGHQLACVTPLDPNTFEIWHWDDHYDERLEMRVTRARHLVVNSPDIDLKFPDLEVSEYSPTTGILIGAWNYRSSDRGEDRHIQDFWHRVLRSSV